MDLGGRQIVERLVWTLVVIELEVSSNALAWSATFEADELQANKAAELMEGALAANCVALKQFVKASYN